jgi:hypothetical protein
MNFQAEPRRGSLFARKTISIYPPSPSGAPCLLMVKTLLSFMVLGLFNSPAWGIEKILEFKIVENDTLTYTLKLALDESGKPQYFFRNIFTPVCYTNECKPVHINFYWDLLGNYMRYDLPKNKVLTKVDHDEFKEEDYQKVAGYPRPAQLHFR